MYVTRARSYCVFICICTVRTVSLHFSKLEFIIFKILLKLSFLELQVEPGHL